MVAGEESASVSLVGFGAARESRGIAGLLMVSVRGSGYPFLFAELIQLVAKVRDRHRRSRRGNVI